MKTLFPILIALLFCGCVDKPIFIGGKVFPAGALDTAENIRKTLSNVLDDGKLVTFAAEEGALVAVVEDFSNSRVLVSFGAGTPTESDFTINGEVYPKRKYQECRIRFYGWIVDELGQHENKEHIADGGIGLMFPLQADDAFSMEASWEQNDFTHKLSLAYTKKAGWISKIVSTPWE